MSSSGSSEPRTVGPLVVGYDDHPSSRRALTQAMDLAALLNVHLRVVHVVDTEDMPIDPDAASWTDELQGRSEMLADHVRGIVSLPPDRWSYVATAGDVWHSLVREADDLGAWLIIVGQRTHAQGIASAIGRLLTGTVSGSVTEALVKHGHVSVLVVAYRDDDNADR